VSTPREHAPVADWVTIPDLYRDPFPIFERLRAEGGVHWVPAANRYLVTSYAAVHDTELDQETFSANEEGSLQIRAMGHSMLRKDDPEHHVERRAWQPVLRPSWVKKMWRPVFGRNAEKYLAKFRAAGPGADLVWDFAAPYVSENLRAVTGLHNATQQDLQRWSQTMIDATGNYADDPDVWAKGEASYNEVDIALDEMIKWHTKHPDESMLSNLLRLPDYQMPLESIRANLKMTIGGGLNEPRDAIGVGAYALMSNPRQRELVESGEVSWDQVFDETIRWVAPIGMYSRQVTRDVVLQGVPLPAGAKLGICVLSANRDDSQWRRPDMFDATRSGEGAHLAFGKGVHVCLGAWVARAEVADIAMPRLFKEFQGFRVDPRSEAEVGGWVFRGMTKLPVDWSKDQVAEADLDRTNIAHIAVVGSGPSGCYTAQAVRRKHPDAEIAVFDSLPTPYGLVRYGVAADHQGTKAVSGQFARLFEQEGVSYVGSTTVGKDVSLQELRSAFDAVVVATGLHSDARLRIPGTDTACVHGAGELSRALNTHPDSPETVPSLGRTTAVVGMGNVAMDMVRLMAKDHTMLDGSDVNDRAHAQLTGELETIHVIGRSLPHGAKFDPVMLREIIALPGLTHVVHGSEAEPLVATEDPRSTTVRELRELRRSGPTRRTIEWWFGYEPVEIRRTDRANASVTLRSCVDNELAKVDTDSVVTAIGFCAGPNQALVNVSEAAKETGRVGEGLYVAGWARRGPTGSIPSQRSDAKQLAEVIAQELPTVSKKQGLQALTEDLGAATSYDGWLVIDAHERQNAAPKRVREKVGSHRDLQMIAGSALWLPELDGTRMSKDADGGATGREPLTVVFGTESGNSELVAEELARSLADTHEVGIVDLTEADIEDIPQDHLVMVVCSTYGDGELPSGVRAFHQKLLEISPDLSGLRYAMFGLGDHTYATTYSRGSEILDAAFTDLGAQRIGDYGRHDAAGSDSAPEMAVQWARTVLDNDRVPACSLTAMSDGGCLTFRGSGCRWDR
jgi:cytochrome P450/flavodoxin